MVLDPDPSVTELATIIHDVTTSLVHKRGRRARIEGDPDCRVLATVVLRRLREAGFEVRRA